MTGKNRGAVMLVSIGVVALSAATALGYILPADAILSSIASKRSDLGIDTLVFEGRHTVNGETGPLWGALLAGRALRLQTERDGATQVRLLSGDREWRFSLGAAPSKPARDEHDLILSYVLPSKRDPGGKRGLAFLKAHGIDAETVSLGRFDDRVAFVIGAKPWETTKPQLWVDKSLRVPLRLVYVDGKNVVHETRLLGFGTEVVDQWFPRVIERLENGVVRERLVVERIDVNEDVDRDLLAPPK